MNRTTIGNSNLSLELDTDGKDTFFTTPEVCSAILNPKDLLDVRDWINERVRELQFQGYLPDQHLAD